MGVHGRKQVLSLQSGRAVNVCTTETSEEQCRRLQEITNLLLVDNFDKMAHQMVAAPSCSLDEIDLNALKVSPDELRNIAAAKCYVVAVFWCSRLCLFAEIQRVRCGLDG